MDIELFIYIRFVLIVETMLGHDQHTDTQINMTQKIKTGEYLKKEKKNQIFEMKHLANGKLANSNANFISPRLSHVLQINNDT